MKARTLAAVASIALAAGSTLPAHSQTGGAVVATKPGTALAAQTVKLDATITAIDPKTRAVTLKGPQGNEVVIIAGPEVKNFAQIRAGDKVVVSYYRGIAAQVLPPGAAASKEVNQLDLGASAQPGAKPAAGVGSAIRGTVVVQKIDVAANQLTILKPDGSSRTIPIESDEGKAFIKKLKKGDKVDVVYAEALAVEVRPQT